MIPRKPVLDAPPALIPLPVAVDLIRFEKNLLQIGFFGAHDTRHHNEATRRIEQWVNRDGQKIKIAAEFRGSEALGLPSTSDRDKYIALMKIAMDQRAKFGRIENPVRFTGYQMLKELGLTFSGENYEDINRWGQRMADTTITSEQVIYLAARKKYANKTVHVFRSFVRAGQSNTADSGRAETYEVVLEDWLLENLNQSYVIPEDFNAYRRLKRPTAKGIFGYLHLWFHASQGRPVEKDYTDLCMLLNIPVYKHVSKIRETMGRSLDELAQVGYLSSWDVRRMVSKEGFKLVLMPGSELQHVLAISQRKGLAAAEAPATDADQRAVAMLVERGVAEPKARLLVRQTGADEVISRVEYADSLLARDRRGKIENPAGFVVYMVESGGKAPEPRRAPVSVPSEEPEHRTRLEEAYQAYAAAEVEAELRRRFPGKEWARRVRAAASVRAREDARFEQMHPAQRESLAEQMLRAEIRESLDLPEFDEWRASAPQLSLFPS